MGLRRVWEGGACWVLSSDPEGVPRAADDGVVREVPGGPQGCVLRRQRVSAADGGAGPKGAGEQQRGGAQLRAREERSPGPRFRGSPHDQRGHGSPRQAWCAPACPPALNITFFQENISNTAISVLF